jgi:hypothetical protein
MRVLAILIIPFLFSCSLFEEDIILSSIARVEDKLLDQSDIIGIVPEGTSREDSILIIDNYIKGWLKDNLILHKAELNLNENQKDVAKQLEDYRSSLIIYSYEMELIKQRLDTNISSADILKFYEENKQNFELRDDIVKVRYLKIHKKAPQIKKIRKVYKSNKEEELEEFKSFAHQYGEKFHLNDEQWILFEELKTEVPINASQAAGYLKNIKNIEVEDSLFFYFVHIKAYKLQNDVSPLSFEAHNIKNIIINKRKLSLINKIRNDLYQEAFLNKDIEIYEIENNEK